MKKLILLTFLFVGNLCFSSMASAQTVDGILEKYYKVCGSPEQWKKFNTMRATGIVSIQGIQLNGSISSMRPNKMITQFEFQGMKIIESFDGTNCWTLNPFMGQTTPQKCDSLATQDKAKQMFEDELIGYKEKGHTATFEGEDEVEGTKVYKIKLVKKSKEEMFYYFDAENYVPILQKTIVENGDMKGQVVEIALSDYQEFDGGLMAPYSISTKANGQVFMQMTIAKIEINSSDINDDNFKMPAESGK